MLDEKERRVQYRELFRSIYGTGKQFKDEGWRHDLETLIEEESTGGVYEHSPLIPITSSHVEAIGYDIEKGVLIVSYWNGTVYEYEHDKVGMFLIYFFMSRVGSVGKAVWSELRRPGITYRRVQ